MKKKHSSEEIPPEKLGPIEEKKFLAAFDLALLAGGFMPLPETHPGSVLAVPSESHIISFYEMETDPRKRVLLAAIEFFSFDDAGCRSFLFRFYSLVKLLADGHLSDWMIRDPNEPEVDGVHRAVLLAAAREPLNENGEFNLKNLLARTEEMAVRIHSTSIKLSYH